MKTSSFSTKATTTRVPASSWWLGLTAAEFYARVRVESDRMNGVNELPSSDAPRGRVGAFTPGPPVSLEDD